MLQKSRVFRRFLLSYLIILFIPILGGFMSYRTSIAVTESISIENSVTQLEKSRELLERRMAEVEGFTRQLAVNQELNVLLNERSSEDGSFNVYGIWRTMKNVLTFGQTNDFLRNYYIYLANYNVILTPGSAYFRPEHYYENYHYNDLSLAEWKTTILGQRHSSDIKPLSSFSGLKVQTSVVTYMQSFPLDSFSSQSPAVAVVLIDEKEIASLLSGLTERYGGWAYISDAGGQTIGSSGAFAPGKELLFADPRFDPDKQSQFYKGDLVITARSQTNGWVYRAGIPREVLMHNANEIKRMTWTLTGVALLIGLLAGLVLAYRNSAPIHRLVRVVREQFAKDGPVERNEFDFLSGNVSGMIAKNKLLETELMRQLPLLRDAFLKRWLAGDFSSREEIFAAAEQAGLEPGGEAGYVGILQISGYSGRDSVETLNELNAARLLLRQALLEQSGSVPVTDLGADMLALLFFTRESLENGENGEDDRAIAERLHELAESMFAEYHITIQAALGEPFLGLTEVRHSFEQAKLALEYAAYSNKKGLLRYRDTQTENATYYYPLDMEQRLIGTVRAGELREAKRIMAAIISRNMEQQELSIEMKHQLVGELKGTFLKLLDQKVIMESDRFEEIKTRIIEIRPTDTREWLAGELDAVMEELCGLIESKRKDSHVRIIEQISRFISENYSDSELTLYRIAEQVERPEKYISQLFKEMTGVNLSDHLERLRMEQAATLLKETVYTVDEIAGRVGYNSSHSFRRAFKRVLGLSPSAYRQLNG